MALQTNGLNWLAQNAGSGDCFTSSGVSYRDADGLPNTGGTKDVVNAFLVADMVGKRTVDIIAGTNYNEFKSINDGIDIEISDVGEAADREAAGGTYPRYCYTAGKICTAGQRRCRTTKICERCDADGMGWSDVQTCGEGYTCQDGYCVVAPDKPTTGPMTVYVGGGSSCPPGTPNVTLDTDDAFTFFKADPCTYIGVGGIQVHNLSSECRIYVTWEVRVWDGTGYTTCPLTVPELKEINRYLAEAGSKPLSPSRMDASGTEIIWGSFEVPTSMEGEKTICLSLWGNFDRDALIAELNAEGYYDK